MLEYIEFRCEEAVLRTGGEPVEDGVPSGSFCVEPSVFGEVMPDSRIARKDIFGPVVSVLAFADYDEMVAIANGTDYGLTTGVWTDSVRTAHRAIYDIEASVVRPDTVRRVQGQWDRREKGLQAIERPTHV